jgi:hypothetical protein
VVILVCNSNAGIRLNSYALDDKVGNVDPMEWYEPKDGWFKEQYRGKDCLVVGGTRGIGRGVALVLAQLGCNVALVGRGAANGAAVVRGMREVAAADLDQKFTAYSADLSTVTGTKAFAKEFMSTNSNIGGEVAACCYYTRTHSLLTAHRFSHHDGGRVARRAESSDGGRAG